MRILTVHGSADPEGNSARLLKAFIEGAQETSGVGIESIHIYDYHVEAPWLNYFGDVMQKQTDNVKDDMPALREKLLAADVIVLATPVHWYQLPGKLKTFVDRWADLIEPDFSSGLAGKGLALLSTHSGLISMQSSNGLQQAMLATAQFLGMQWMGAVSSRAAMPFAVWDDEPAVAAARQFGHKIGQGINQIGQQVLGA